MQQQERRSTRGGEELQPDLTALKRLATSGSLEVVSQRGNRRESRGLSPSSALGNRRGSGNSQIRPSTIAFVLLC